MGTATPADVNVAKAVIDQIKALDVLPKTWRFYPFVPTLDTISSPVVVLVFDEYTRSKFHGWRIASFVLTLIEPQVQPGRADEALSEKIIDLLNAIDKLSEGTTDTMALQWTSAKRGTAANGQNPGFDITLTLPIKITS